MCASTSAKALSRFRQNIKNPILLVVVCLLALLGPVQILHAGEINPDWVGPYVGATLGASSTAATIDNGANGNDLDVDDSGASVGIVGGYNFAPFGKSESGSWLIGVEADLQNISSDASATDSLIGKAQLESNWLASTRLRTGYAWDKYHLYGTAGLAFSDIHVETTSDQGDDFNVGIALGVGGEIAMTNNWTARLEGLIYGFGEEDRNISNTKHDIGMGSSVLRVGVIRTF